MSVDDRLDRLEQRVAVMEKLVRSLVGQGGRGGEGETAPPPPAVLAQDPVAASLRAISGAPPVSPPPPPAAPAPRP